MASVYSCHPILLWDVGISFNTVKTLFKSNTPWLAHEIKSPVVLVIPKSSYNSLYIFLRDGGNLMPSFTENDNPFASFSPWYGSCPKITTFTSL